MPVLTPADHEHFIAQGYVIVRDVVPPDECRRAVEILNGDDAAAREKVVLACETPRLLAAVNELFAPSRVTEVRMRPHEAPRPRQDDVEWRALPQHVDVPDPHLLAQSWALGVFVFLSEIRPHGGAFMLCPGSPRRLRAAMSRTSSESAWTAAQDAERFEISELLARPGEAVIFDHLLVHCGSLNTADPQTRRAINIRYLPKDPVRPAGKSFSAMSTVERAGSLRYLADRFDDGVVLPNVPDVDDIGFTVDGGVAAQAASRGDGMAEIWFTSHREPDVVQVARSADLVSWAVEPTGLTRADGPVRALHVDREGGDPRLVVVTDGGTVVHARDGGVWRDVVRTPGLRLGRPRWVHLALGAAEARGDVGWYVDPLDPRVVRWRASKFHRDDDGLPWERFDEWPNTGVASEVPVPVGNVAVHHIRDLTAWALVVDTADGPLVSVSTTADRFDPPIALVDQPDPAPQQLRPYEVGDRRWLLTYLADGVVRWGTIDWRSDDVRLVPVTDGKSLAAAIEDLGLA